jgi:PAS domain S-box-containing protein
MHKDTGSRVLIVEDDSRLSASFRDLLNSHGLVAQVSPGLSDALRSIAETSYDVILLDLNLKNQCAFPILDRLSDTYQDSKVIVVTGMQSEKKVITAYQKGVADYLKKPVAPDDLLASIQRALSMRRLQRQKVRLKEVIVASRERYRSVVDCQREYLCRLDRQLRITFINKAFARHCKSDPQALIGRPIKSYLPESIYETLNDKLDGIQSGSRMLILELPTMGAHARTYWQQWRFQGVGRADGGSKEIQCTCSDITRNKEIAKTALNEKERFRHLAEMTSDWLWEVDSGGTYTYASPVVFDLLGYSPEEVVGKKRFDFMLDEEAKRIEGLFHKAIAAGKQLRAVENINIHKNGTRVTLETSGVPIFDTKGNTIGYRGIDRDISARKLVEKQLREKTAKLEQALKEVKRLSGLLPICSSCKKIRDDSGYWLQIEEYITDHSEATFSHGLCPSCFKKLYPELDFEDEI